MCALSFMYARVLALHACQGGHAYVRLCVCVCVFARCCSLRVWGFSLAGVWCIPVCAPTCACTIVFHSRVAPTSAAHVGVCSDRGIAQSCQPGAVLAVTRFGVVGRQFKFHGLAELVHICVFVVGSSSPRVFFIAIYSAFMCYCVFPVAFVFVFG